MSSASIPFGTGQIIHEQETAQYYDNKSNIKPAAMTLTHDLAERDASTDTTPAIVTTARASGTTCRESTPAIRQFETIPKLRSIATVYDTTGTPPQN